LRRNAAIEACAGAAVILIVAQLGLLPPAIHATHHHPDYTSAVPADAAFQHIHAEQGMADVTIEPGRVGTARATIRLWNDDLEKLAAREVTLTLTAPSPGSKPTSRRAQQNADGTWRVDGVALTEAGDWTVKVDAALDSGRRLSLEAPIVIDPK